MSSFLNKKLKVHYAGSEQWVFTSSLAVAGVKYGLYTVFPCICSSVGLRAIVMGTKALNTTFERLPMELHKQNKHTIMDSGIFALAYGQMKGKVSTDMIYKWYDAYIRFANDFVPAGITMVEVDCQSIINPSVAWEFRKKLREDCKKHEHINVWHFEDGRTGLDRIIEFSNYIGFSVPEYRRILGIGKYKQFVKQLCFYTKAKKPEIKIHLLGCTSKCLLESLCNTVDSVDSTAWISAGKYGGRNPIERGIASREAGGIEYQACLNQLSRFYCLDNLSDGLKRDCARRALAALYWKKEYTTWCGSQE